MAKTKTSSLEPLSESQLDSLVRGIGQLPTPPSLIKHMLEATASSQDKVASPHGAELLRLAEMDVAMSTSLLRTSKDDIARHVLRAALNSHEEVGLDLGQFGVHCLAVAWLTRRIAETLSLPVNLQQAWTCGLLHDLGKLALASAMPRSYARVLETCVGQQASLCQVEREILGVDHVTFGRRLAQAWNLGPTLESVLWLHHQAATALGWATDGPLVAVVGLADAIARREQLGFSGNYAFALPTNEWAVAVGLNEPALGELTKRVRQFIEEHAPKLSEPADAGAIQTSVQRACRNLIESQASSQAQTAALRRRAEAFDVAASFLVQLGTQGSVGDVLQGIVQASAKVLGLEPSASQPIIAYSIDRSAAAVLALCANGSQLQWFNLPCTASASATPAGSAADAMAQLTGRRDDLNLPVRMEGLSHDAFVCSGQWVGGLMYDSAKTTRPSTACASEDRNLVGPLPQGRGSEMPRANDPWPALASMMAMALAIVQGKERTEQLGRQLAGASQVLAETSQALADARTTSAIADLAAGAAHELNNPLTVISLRAQRMQAKAPPAEKEVWKNIVDQAQRASDIVTDLMEMASPPAPRPTRIEPRQLLEAARQEFAKSDATQVITPTVDIDSADDAPPAFADATQLAGVLAELIRNAAIAGGSNVRVKLSATGLPAGAGLVIRVADNGPGMDEATLAKAMTPFYSHQPAGRRRGMGLPRARRLVEVNGGQWNIQSHPGRGTTVTITLPTTK